MTGTRAFWIVPHLGDVVSGRVGGGHTPGGGTFTHTHRPGSRAGEVSAG